MSSGMQESVQLICVGLPLEGRAEMRQITEEPHFFGMRSLWKFSLVDWAGPSSCSSS